MSERTYIPGAVSDWRCSSISRLWLAWLGLGHFGMVRMANYQQGGSQSGARGRRDQKAELLHSGVGHTGATKGRDRSRDFGSWSTGIDSGGGWPPTRFGWPSTGVGDSNSAIERPVAMKDRRKRPRPEPDMGRRLSKYSQHLEDVADALIRSTEEMRQQYLAKEEEADGRQRQPG